MKTDSDRGREAERHKWEKHTTRSQFLILTKPSESLYTHLACSFYGSPVRETRHLPTLQSSHRTSENIEFIAAHLHNQHHIPGSLQEGLQANRGKGFTLALPPNSSHKSLLLLSKQSLAKQSSGPDMRVEMFPQVFEALPMLSISDKKTLRVKPVVIHV